MALDSGARFGPYEILGPLGAGGMGEVYRARDTKLGRDVALKVLPDAFAGDPDRLARFRREAQVLASLNHSNIAAIYGLEEADAVSGFSRTVSALVLELVDGETLADRISRGPIPIDEALPIARQIAEALEAAHEHGIVHRDLKPANIKLRDNGTVKVLDFGLAKLAERGPTEAGHYVADSPTITSPALLTGIGMLLGTAAYMAPEQARGKSVDKRADIWAFGCVLYQMLAGTRAFEGDDVSDTLATVLKSAPDWTKLPATVPPLVRLGIQECLEKDRARRLADMSAVRFAISDQAVVATAGQPASTTRAAASRYWALAAVAVVLSSALTGAALWALLPRAGQPTVTRFTYALPEGEVFTDPFTSSVALSRDGTQMAYVANQRIYLKPMSELTARPIPGTETQTNLIYVTFSPDGRSIVYWVRTGPGGSGFSTRGEIRRIATTGGAAITLARLEGGAFAMTWDGETLLFAQPGRGIMRVSENGSKEPELVVPTKGDDVLRGIQVLPGGDAVLFTVKPGGSPMATQEEWDEAQIVAQRFDSSERKPVARGTDARYLPTGHVLFVTRGVMFAVPFDIQRLEPRGAPVPVLEGVLRTMGAPVAGSATGGAHFSVSDTGTIAYVPGPASGGFDEARLMLTDRLGRSEALPVPPGAHESVRVSRDGKQAAIVTSSTSETYVSIYDLSGGTAPRRLTLQGNSRFAVWATDSHVAFQSDREGDLAIWRQRADGTTPAERLTRPEPGTEHVPGPWFPEGRRFLLVERKKEATDTLQIFSLGEGKAQTFGGVQNRGRIRASLSPNGRWVAYTPTGGEATGILLQPVPATGAVYPGPSPGRFPHWSGNDELLYSALGQLRSVKVRTEPSVTIGNPVPLPSEVSGVLAPALDYDVMPGGGFIAVTPAGKEVSGRQIHIVQDWFEELKARVPSP